MDYREEIINLVRNIRHKQALEYLYIIVADVAGEVECIETENTESSCGA